MTTNTVTMKKRFQSTHPVRGATASAFYSSVNLSISIHAPRERCDLQAELDVDVIFISIHAPRERCDSRYIFI